MSKTALVTGGAIRLGRSVALGLASDGFDIAVHYNTSAGEAQKTAESIEALGQRAYLIQGDLSEAGAAAEVAGSLEAEPGRVDVLVNSASTYVRNAIDHVSPDEWDRVMAVNVRAPFLLTKELTGMLASAQGCVINMVDLSAFQAWTEYPHHSVSKAALLHLTKVQARAMAPTVRVNAVAPGNVLPPERDDPDTVEASRRHIPLGRIGEPANIVDAVRFLIGATYMTGEVLVVDGGRLLNT